MALNWQWEDKIGEATMVANFPDDEKEQEYTVDIYVGNCPAVFVYQVDEKRYQVQSFFVDKEHAKRVLGTDKKYKESYGCNDFDRSYCWMKELRFDKKRKECQKLIPLFIEATWKHDFAVKLVDM